MARGGAAKVVETACGPLSDVGVLPRARMGRYEIELVQQKRRACRASWQDCANMVGRSVHDVRVACDPAYAGDEMVPARGPLGAPAIKLKDLTHVEALALNGLAEFEAEVVVGDRKSKEVTTTELARAIRAGTNSTGTALNQLEQRGLVRSRRTSDSHRLSCLTLEGSRLVEGRAHG